MDDPAQDDALTVSLRTLNQLAKHLKAQRTATGALTLASPEVRFTLCRHIAATLPSHCRHIAVTLPLHCRCIAVALPLHYRCITVAFYSCITVALPLRFDSYTHRCIAVTLPLQVRFTLDSETSDPTDVGVYEHKEVRV